MKLNVFRWNQHNTQHHLLFLHGLGGTGQIWRPIIASLESEFDCLAPDQRGHGLSRPIPENEKDQFHALDYAKDIEESLKNLEISKCIVIGHSMGVRTALALSALIPEKVQGIMALDLGVSSQWGGGMGISLSQFIQKLPENFPSREEMKTYLAANCPDPAIAQYLAAVSKRSGPPFSQKAEQRVKNENLNIEKAGMELWVFPFEHSALVKTIEQAHQAPLKEWVLMAQKNKIPILFLHGRNSKVWSTADYETQRAELEGPYLQFESWENTGHGLPFEQRAKFLERLKLYITQTSAFITDPQ